MFSLSGKGKQVHLGKAFEYACLKALHTHLSNNQEIEIDNTSSYEIAKGFYENIEPEMREKMDKGASAAIKVILRLEPQITTPLDNAPLYLAIQEDAKGISGDVRDVVCYRKQNSWEMGISCKHNHNAVKHSRLSQNIDFGEQWFNIPCSKDYFNEINPIFDRLRELKQKKAKWSDLEDKESAVYIPLLEAFMKELKKLHSENSEEIPKRLLKYLIGTNDFYKVISLDNRNVTQLQSYNMFGTLNKNASKVHPQIKIKQMPLPTTFYNIDFKKGSGNTIEVVCDAGWTVSFRIHNAATLVEPSLKFDVKLNGVPQQLYSHFEPWE